MGRVLNVPELAWAELVLGRVVLNPTMATLLDMRSASTIVQLWFEHELALYFIN